MVYEVYVPSVVHHFRVGIVDQKCSLLFPESGRVREVSLEGHEPVFNATGIVRKC